MFPEMCLDWIEMITHVRRRASPLALLHLVLLNRLPPSLDIKAGDILHYAQLAKSELRDYDVVLANPPFVRPIIRKLI